MHGNGADSREQSGDPNELGIPRTSIHRWLPKGQRGLLQRQAELLVSAQPQHEKSPAAAAAEPATNGRRPTIDDEQNMELTVAPATTETVTIDVEPPTANKTKMYTDIF